MKKMIFLTLMAMGHLAFSQQAQQGVSKDLGTFKDWKVAQITNHDLWHSDACVAYTAAEKNASTLELYAPLLTGTATGEYARATFQVVARGLPGFVQAVLQDDQGSAKFSLTLASNSATPAGFGLLARLEDREKLLELLKKASAVTVSFLDQKKAVVKKLSFSLRGSSKGLDTALSSCQISL